MSELRKPRIGVCGPHDATSQTTAWAEEVGVAIARRGAILVCGGLGGVMEAAARGARAAGGLTVGIIPSADEESANRFIDVPIVTGMGEARNVILVRSCHALIAIAGAYGTLSEIALAMKMNVPVVGLNTWRPLAPDKTVPPILVATSPADAVEKAFRAIAK